MTGNINSATIGIQGPNGINALAIGVNNTLVHDNLSINIYSKPSWLNVSHFENSITPGESSNLTLEVNTAGLLGGSYSYNLEITSNDFHNPLISLPVNLNVNDQVCDGAQIGDLNNDGELNVLDIILIVNIILYGSDDECELILSDLNNDANIDVLDIVLIINFILD